MLQEVLRANIEAKLNDNTVAYADDTTNSILFVLGQYYQKDDKSPSFIYNIDNGFRAVEASYVPCTMNFQAEYQALYGQKTGSATAYLVFLIALDDDVDNKLSALDQVVSKIVGKSEVVVDGSTSYNTAWNMSAFTDTQKIEFFNGVKYIEITTQVYVEFSDTAHFGNEYSVTLDENIINFLTFRSERNAQENYPHIVGETEAKGGIETNARTYVLTAYVDDFLSTLTDTWESAYDQDEVHQLTLESPTVASPIDLSVVIKDYSYVMEKGEKVSINITFLISDTAYVEPTFTITYVLDGGSRSTNPLTFVSADLPITLVDAIKAGYNFDAWYEDVALTTPITVIDTAANITIYATYTEQTWGWDSSTESYWNSLDVLMRGTTLGTTGNQPSETPNDYPLGYCMRVIVEPTEPAYEYWKVNYGN